MTNLYNELVNNFNRYLQSGELQTKIRSWAADRVPPVPDLFEVQILGAPINTDGTFVNPLDDPEATVEALSITTSGKLLVTGLVTSSFSSAQEDQAKADFESAIKSSLGSSLPLGSTVKVISLDNGVVNYVITLVGFDSSADATSAAATAANSLENALGDISSAIGGTSTLAGVTVVGNTPGTIIESEAAVVTSSGKLSTGITGLTPTQKIEISDYFESAIAATLIAEGALPEGSYVTATISDTGIVSYVITMHLNPSGDNAIIVKEINSELSSGSTLTVISSAVTSAISSAPGSLPSSLLTVTISGNTPGESKGVSFKPWYPDWGTFGNYCLNDGNNPVSMSKPDNKEYYLFETLAECCANWFAYAPDCAAGASETSFAEEFYPDWLSAGCSKKLSSEFKSWEQERYDTLDQCCAENFSYAKQNCCDSLGMGGCDATNEEIIFLPDWKENKCFSKSKNSLELFEEGYVESNQSACCSKYFKWSSSCDD
jgi:hypothetical protein